MSNEMSNGDDKSRIKILSMPALGRHFDLGTVYDAVNDAIIPGFTFWNGSDLKNVKTTVKHNTKLSIIASDKLNDKFQELKVNGSVQVGILCGQIELGGSANYLNQKKSTSRESSVHLTLQRRTAVKELLMIEQLLAEIQKSGQIGSATHIVTQIQYGAEATFTFTKKLSETENESEVNGQLKLGAEKFTQFLDGNANVGGNHTDRNQENEDNIECHFQGDFELPDDVESPPTTYNEAIEFAKKFWQFSSDRVMAKDDADGNKSLGVPVIVWLYPLKDVQGAPAHRYEIPQWMASECALIMDKYGEVEDKLVLMLEDPLLEKLSPLRKKLQQLFQRYLASFIAELKNKLWEMVVGFRSGKITEEDFKSEMSRISNEQFTFNSNRLKQWLDQKNQELCLIKRFQDEVKSNKSKVLFFPSASTLQQQMTKFPVDFGFEISFSYLARPEPFLQLLNQTFGTNYLNEISLPTNNVNFDLWCENNSVFKRIEKEIVIFAELVNAKSNDEKFAFAMTTPDEYNDICASQFSMIVHHKQKRIFGWDAVLNVCRHYKKKKMIDIIRLLADEEEINETWNSIPLLALCRYYKKDNLIDIVRLLIDKEIDVNCKTNDGWNALLAVCRYYDKDNLIEIVELLIEKKIDVNCKTDDELNALLFVCKHHDKENLIKIVQLLLNKNIDVNCRTKSGRDNALTILCQYYKRDNLLDIIQLLIKKKIDVNCKEKYEWNALLPLCRHYDKENLISIIQLLLDEKIEVNCKTNAGWNALLYLCRYYDKENLIKIVQLLLDNKIDVNCRTKSGRDNALTLLCQFYQKENLIGIVQLLIGNNIDVNCKDNDGWNALHIVCRFQPKRRLVDLVSILVRHEIDKKVKTTGGEIGTARSFLLNRFEEDEVADVLQMLDS